jgi:hypothetical protein
MNVTRYNATIDDEDRVLVIYPDPEGELVKWSDVKPINVDRFNIDIEADYYGFQYLWIRMDKEGKWVWAADLMEI